MKTKKGNLFVSTVAERIAWKAAMAHLPEKLSDEEEARFEAEDKKLEEETEEAERKDVAKMGHDIIQEIKEENEIIRKKHLQIRREAERNNEGVKHIKGKWTRAEVNKKSEQLIRGVGRLDGRKPMYWPYANMTEWMKPKWKRKTRVQIIKENRLKALKENRLKARRELS